MAAAAAPDAGSVALAVVAGVLLLLCYVELRRLLGAPGSRLTLLLGAASIGGFVWAGHAGRPEDLPWVLAALVLVLLVARLLLAELTGAAVRGATDDIAATSAAAATVGVLGAHVLLIGALPRHGFRSVLLFGLLVLATGVVVYLGSRAGRRRASVPGAGRDKTWMAPGLGLVAASVTGLLAGLALDPFSAVSGALLGVGVGILSPMGDLVEDALKQSAGVEGSAGMGRLGGVLDTLDGPLFSAPFFYWALRAFVV